MPILKSLTLLPPKPLSLSPKSRLPPPPPLPLVNSTRILLPSRSLPSKSWKLLLAIMSTFHQGHHNHGQWAHNKTKVMYSVQLPLQRPQHHAGHQTRQTQILPKTRSMIGQAVSFDEDYLNRNVPYSSIALEEFLNVPVKKSR